MSGQCKHNWRPKILVHWSLEYVYRISLARSSGTNPNYLNVDQGDSWKVCLFSHWYADAGIKNDTQEPGDLSLPADGYDCDGNVTRYFYFLLARFPMREFFYREGKYKFRRLKWKIVYPIHTNTSNLRIMYLRYVLVRFASFLPDRLRKHNFRKHFSALFNFLFLPTYVYTHKKVCNRRNGRVRRYTTRIGKLDYTN